MHVDRARFDLRRRLAGAGVYYGWVIVGACFLSALITWGTIFSFGVFFDHIESEFGLSHANTSIIFSLQSVVMYDSAAVLGFVIDRHGARRLLLLATGLVVVGLLGVSQLPTALGVTLSYGVVAAVGFGIIFVVSYVTPVRWFDRRRGLAVGIATAGAGIGTFVVPPISELLITRVGWRVAYAVLTIGFLVVLLLAVLVLADRPGDLGIEVSTEPDPETIERPPVGDDWRSQVRDVLYTGRSPAFVAIFLAYLCLSATMFVLLVNIVEYTTSIGLGRSVGIAALGVLGAMNATAKFVGGSVVDRIGGPSTVAASGVLQATGICVLLFVPHPLAVLGAAVVFGFGWGMWIGFLAPLLAGLFGTLSINALFGLTAIAFGISGLLGPYAAGIGFDTLGTFRPVFLVTGGLSLVGAGLVLLSERFANATPRRASDTYVDGPGPR